MERIYHFSIVTSQLYCNELCNNKRERFTDTKLQQRDCCEELCLRFNVGQLGVDVKLEQTATDFDDIKYGNLRFNRLGREITEREWKNHQQSNTAHFL